MRKFVLVLDYGRIVIKGLRDVWIQPNSLRPGYALCYADTIYGRNFIYCSTDLELLKEVQHKLIRAYNSGTSAVRL